MTCIYTTVLYLMICGHLRLGMILTLWAGGMNWTGSFLSYLFKGWALRQSNAAQVRPLVAYRLILCQLFAQDLTYFLSWGWFKNIGLFNKYFYEVQYYSINIDQIRNNKIYLHLNRNKNLKNKNILICNVIVNSLIVSFFCHCSRGHS